MGENDRTIHGVERVRCCDCGMVHLYDHAVLRAPDGAFHLITRAYVLEHGRARKGGTSKSTRKTRKWKKGKVTK
jgi:hypothetical protein